MEFTFEIRITNDSAGFWLDATLIKAKYLFALIVLTSDATNFLLTA